MKKIKIFSLSVLTFLFSLLTVDESIAILFDAETLPAVFSAGAWNFEIQSTETPDETESNEPDVLFYKNTTGTKVGFIVQNISNFKDVGYEIKYTHDADVAEAITGEIDNSEGNDTVLEEWIILGKSSNGIYTYYQDIGTITLTIFLGNDGIIERTLSASI